MPTPLWSVDDLVRHLGSPPPAHASAYFAMYHGGWNALITDPRLMWVPVDDHLVHRGDGVFETLLAEGGAIYNLRAHLARLCHSAEAISISPPPLHELEERCVEVFRAAGRPRALARLLLGRGPGGFAVDPRECPQPSVYIVVYAAPPPFMDRNPGGARVVLSQVPPKSGGLARIKTCNYLPNVLMKREAIQADAHFALGVDDDGFVTESYTENVAAVDVDGTLLVPPALHHLPGTTLARVAELASAHGRTVREQRLRPADLQEMAELLVVGTTAYVTRVHSLGDHVFAPGPVSAELDRWLREDIRGNVALRTPFLPPEMAT